MGIGYTRFLRVGNRVFGVFFRMAILPVPSMSIIAIFTVIISLFGREVVESAPDVVLAFALTVVIGFVVAILLIVVPLTGFRHALSESKRMLVTRTWETLEKT